MSANFIPNVFSGVGTGATQLPPAVGPQGYGMPAGAPGGGFVSANPLAGLPAQDLSALFGRLTGSLEGGAGAPLRGGLRGFDFSGVPMSGGEAASGPWGGDGAPVGWRSRRGGWHGFPSGGMRHGGWHGHGGHFRPGWHHRPHFRPLPVYPHPVPRPPVGFPGPIVIAGGGTRGRHGGGPIVIGGGYGYGMGGPLVIGGGTKGKHGGGPIVIGGGAGYGWGGPLVIGGGGKGTRGGGPIVIGGGFGFGGYPVFGGGYGFAGSPWGGGYRAW